MSILELIMKNKETLNIVSGSEQIYPDWEMDIDQNDKGAILFVFEVESATTDYLTIEDLEKAEVMENGWIFVKPINIYLSF